MSEETKNKQAEELTDETLEQVSGGIREPEVLQARCPECNFTFYYRDHGGMGPFSCPNCNYKFPQKPDFITLPDFLPDPIPLPEIPEK